MPGLLQLLCFDPDNGEYLRIQIVPIVGIQNKYTDTQEQVSTAAKNKSHMKAQTYKEEQVCLN